MDSQFKTPADSYPAPAPQPSSTQRMDTDTVASQGFYQGSTQGLYHNPFMQPFIQGRSNPLQPASFQPGVEAATTQATVQSFRALLHPSPEKPVRPAHQAYVPPVSIHSAPVNETPASVFQTEQVDSGQYRYQPPRAHAVERVRSAQAVTPEPELPEETVVAAPRYRAERTWAQEADPTFLEVLGAAVQDVLSPLLLPLNGISGWIVAVGEKLRWFEFDDRPISLTRLHRVPPQTFSAVSTETHGAEPKVYQSFHERYTPDQYRYSRFR